MRRTTKDSRIVEDHFSLWEGALFDEMNREVELDRLVDALFPDGSPGKDA